MSEFLNMRDAGKYLGQSYRWMQRHWVDLVKSGVEVYRVPRDAAKGRILFNRESLGNYMSNCRLRIQE